MIRLMLFYVVFAFHILFRNGSFAAEERHCLFNDVRKELCGENELCVVNVCKCLKEYTRLNDKCVRNNPNSIPSPLPAGHTDEQPNYDNTNDHVAVAIIVPIMLILMVLGTVVIIRKYNLVGWVRNKIYQRQTPYDEVMIGQDDDDPPLSGV